MAAVWRTVRVFISSTFRDMHAERDRLVTVVFPELRERLAWLGLELFDVDLRWGVPETGVDGERANSWAYCKQWIDRVEPFFISMLGQRYGHRPDAQEILDGEDRQEYGGLSITEMEVRHAALSGRVQRRSFFYFRTMAVPEDAPADIYKTFVDVEDADDLNALKHVITEESARPVRCYDRQWQGDRFGEMEAFGRMVLEDLWSGVLRDERYVSKQAWQTVRGCEPDDDSVYTDESEAIPEEVWRELVEAARPEPPDPLDAEAQQMARFAESRLRRFQGRSDELTALGCFVNETDTAADSGGVCVVRAVAGQGKSALLAKFAEQLHGSPHFVLPHFVGVTDRSSDARSLLERLVRELEKTLLREVLEETGLSVVLRRVVGSAQWEYPDVRVAYVIMEGCITSGEIRMSNEHDAFAWVGSDELPALAVCEQFKMFLETYCGSQEKQENS